MSRFPMMMWLSVVCILCTHVSAEPSSDDAKVIPLDKIWAYDMPGTRDIRSLEPKLAAGSLSNEALIRGSLVLQIRKMLQNRPKLGEKAGPAFVVIGTDQEALKNAHAVMAVKGKKEPPQILPANKELSLVFYSYTCGRYVRIKPIESKGNVIRLKYQFVGHATLEMRTHFALIPLGNLPAGKYQVEIEELEAIDDRGHPEKSIRDPKQLVCDSCSFTVKGE